MTDGPDKSFLSTALSSSCPRVLASRLLNHLPRPLTFLGHFTGGRDKDAGVFHLAFLFLG